MTSLALIASVAVIAAETSSVPAAEKAPAKPARKKINLSEVQVQGDTKRAVQIVIPRDSSVTKEFDVSTEHLLDASRRR